MYGHVYTEEEIEWLRENKDTPDLTAQFNLKFKPEREISRGCLSQAMVRRGIIKNNNGQFKPGQIPHNKGKKGINGESPTRFKKGNRPHTWRPKGTEVIDSEGYHYIKLDDHKHWQVKARWLYEQHHGVKLTRDDIIIHLDNDKANHDIENLYLMRRNVHIAMNKHGGHELTGELKITMANVIMLNISASRKKR